MLNPRLLVGGLLVLALAVPAWVALLRQGPLPASAAVEGPSLVLVQELRSLREVGERTLGVLARIEGQLADPMVGLERHAAPLSGAAGGDSTMLDGSMAALRESMDALRLAYEAESDETQEILRSAPALGGESVRAARERRSEVDWEALKVLETAWRSDPDAADRSQYFQTARDLVEAYGPPTAIHRPKGDLAFYYHRGPSQSPGPAWYFRIKEGLVVEFFIDDQTGE